MNQAVKGIGAVIAVVGALIWMFAGVKANQVGGTGNNGYTDPMPQMKPETQKKVEAMMGDEKRRPNFEEMAKNPGAADEMAKKFESNFTPEEQKELKEMRGKMQERMKRIGSTFSPEEQKALRDKMMAGFRARREARQAASGGQQ